MISEEVIRFIEETLKNWRVELTVGGKSLAEVIILKGNFQGWAHKELFWFWILSYITFIRTYARDFIYANFRFYTILVLITFLIVIAEFVTI